MTSIVIDPGHGGDRVVGSSTPYGVRGERLCEKTVALDIAMRVSDHASMPIRLTRCDDRNLALADRIAIARTHAATTFVSIHAGGADAQPEAWLHARANPASHELAARIADALGSRMVLRGTLGVLDPDLHAPGCASCLVEVGRFGRGAHASEQLLRDPAYREQIARSLAQALVAESFDIWHEVPLVEQLTGMSCWAAAAAMIVGWRDRVHIDAQQVARGAGRLQAYRDGLEPADVATFARIWGLQAAQLRELSVAELRTLLADHGPLWVGEASPGLHVIVVAGMYGDGSVAGTHVRIADPWPVGRGERYTLSFREFRDNLRNAALIAGGHPQVLHAPRGSRPS
jgi:hypothetical protein